MKLLGAQQVIQDRKSRRTRSFVALRPITFPVIVFTFDTTLALYLQSMH